MLQDSKFKLFNPHARFFIVGCISDLASVPKLTSRQGIALIAVGDFPGVSPGTLICLEALLMDPYIMPALSGGALSLVAIIGFA